MVRKKIIGNWKMHGSIQQVHALTQALLDCSAGKVSNIDRVVCPPFIYLERVVQQLADSGIQVGAQDVSAHGVGAHTGEVSADMLADAGCRYVLIGHSERRQSHGESEALVAAKLSRALEAGLTPVVCVGETLAQREADVTLSVIDAQLQPVLGLSAEAQQKVVIAYEPVWAIGTGKTATPEQAQEVHVYIRHALAVKNAATAASVSLLYGGSVNAENAASLFAQADIDGALVGGASLDAQQFAAIWRAAEI